MEIPEEVKKSTYYKDHLPDLITRLKNSIAKIEVVIDQDIDTEIKDDKMFNVLKAKRQASEDVIWTMKKIDDLENELNGYTEDVKSDEENKQTAVSPAKRFAKKN
jgi:GTP-binding protein EngB required for normal cell division